MPGRLFVLLAVTISILSGCTSGKDVLATINDKPIERNELREWMMARKINPDILRTDPMAGQSLLKQLAIEKIISEKAVAEGFDRNADYRIIRDMVYRNFLSSYYNSRHFRKLKFTEKCADISIIRIFYKGDTGGGDYKAKSELVNNTILPLLANGEDFSSVASRYSMDSARTRGGRLGFVPLKMLEDELQPVVLSIAEGAYTDRPVSAGKSLCIIRMNKMVDLTGDNIDQYITDKVTRGRILAYVKRQAAEVSEKNLKDNPGTISRLAQARFNTGSELIFKTGNVTCTAGDVKKILNLFYMHKNNEIRNNFTVDELKSTAERMFREAVISIEAERLGYENEPEFKKNWQYLERTTLTGMYKSNYLIKNISVSRDEVESAYKSALKKNVKGKPGMNEPGNIKEGIYSRIYRSKFKKVKEDWENSILAENRYVPAEKN